MSKRSGEFDTLDDLLDDVGVDAVRYLLAASSADAAMDFDLQACRGAIQRKSRALRPVCARVGCQYFAEWGRAGHHSGRRKPRRC